MEAEQHAVVHHIVVGGEVLAEVLPHDAVVESLLHLVVERFTIDLWQCVDDRLDVFDSIIVGLVQLHLDGTGRTTIDGLTLGIGSVLVRIAETVGELAEHLAQMCDGGSAGDGHIGIYRLGLVCLECLVPACHAGLAVVVQCLFDVYRGLTQEFGQHSVGTVNRGLRVCRCDDIVAEILQFELVLQTVHQTSIHEERLYMDIGLTDGAGEALCGEVLVVAPIVIYQAAGAGFGALWQLVIWHVAAAMVMHNKHVLLCGTGFGRPVDEIRQRIGTGVVGIVGSVDVGTRIDLLLE